MLDPRIQNLLPNRLNWYKREKIEMQETERPEFVIIKVKLTITIEW